MVETCCCCDLRTGILFIAIFGLLHSGYMTYSNFHGYKALIDIANTHSKSTLERDLPVAYKHFKVIIRLSLVGVVFESISMLANLLLLWSYCSPACVDVFTEKFSSMSAIQQRNRDLAFLYLFWNIFMLLYTFGLTIFFIAIWDGFQFVFALNILWWVFSIYLMIVVYSYIQTLRENPFEVVVMQAPQYAKSP